MEILIEGNDMGKNLTAVELVEPILTVVVVIANPRVWDTAMIGRTLGHIANARHVWNTKNN